MPEPSGQEPETTLPAAPLSPSELAADPRRLAAALAAVLDQQSRDASANRAQARELIRAVDGLSKAHEFLGIELREERRRSRSLLAALVVVPLAVLAAGGFLAWTVWGTDDKLETFRASVEGDLRDLRERRDKDLLAASRADYQGRLDAAATDASALRTDLDSTRGALADERKRREARDREVTGRLADAERDRADLTGLRSEMSSLREVAGAEKARADEMARLLAEVARAGARTGRPAEAAPPVAPPDAGAAPGTPAPAGASAAGAPLPPAPAPTAPAATTGDAAPVPPPQPPADTATRDAADLARVRTKLNALLEGLTGASRYEVETLSGVSGTELLGVRVIGRDADGNALRSVEAGRAEITVTDGGGIRLRFTDGHLVIGGRTAPFFEGAYTIALDGPSKPWRESGLTCVRFQ